MSKTDILNPDESLGLPNSEEKKFANLKFNEKALCRAFINQFHTMGILTSAETGMIINRIDCGHRPTL